MNGYGMKCIALMLAAAPFALAQLPQATAPDCAADGTVVNSITGEPVQRARLNLSSATAQYATASDNSGRWSIPALTCGRVALTVTRPGFLQYVPPAALNLVSGVPAHDVKVELIPQSVIYGKVVDDQGDPIMSVIVSVLLSHVVEGKASFLQTAGGNSTNDLGEYRFPGLPRGKYIVCAHPALQGVHIRSAPQTLTGDLCYPGPVEGGSSSALDVPAGREVNVDFVLNQVPAVHVRGVFSVLPEGRGIGIRLIRSGAAGGLGESLPAVVRDGKFDVLTPPGSYILVADYFEAGKRLSARVPIEVGTSDLNDIAVHLDNAFTVDGTVRIESPSGRTSQSQPFAISLRPSEPSNGAGQLNWGLRGTSFAFKDLLPGSYSLRLRPNPPFYIASATLAGQDIGAGEFSLSQGAGPIAIVLRDDGGSIEGDSVDADGQPAPGGIMALRNGNIVVAQSGTGHFKLLNLAPGDYTVYAWTDISQVEYANPEWMRRYSGVQVTVTAGQNSQVKVTQQTVPE